MVYECKHCGESFLKPDMGYVVSNDWDDVDCKRLDYQDICPVCGCPHLREVHLRR
ncbi:hypothetical protein [Candidatus Bathycorpusculum sp.]|uniref:hypothetical protein n=1 Tax=Candidatus Bathycorpusculum sp. TaxID=2994959 RepID=UPI00281CD9BF|nr:hypothetical protein [Candidatus Termitimicrobium sp.]MCL2432688.1 hypothetical protein [Candidatus Termitimicrobium sp.]